MDIQQLQQLKQCKILVIGESCCDRYQFGECTRISPEAPVPVFKVSYKKDRYGMAANVGLNLKGLGQSVLILSGDENIVKERFIDENFRQQVLRADHHDQVHNLDMEIFYQENLDEFDAIVISDYDKGLLTHKIIEDILLHAEKHKLPVFVDTKKKDISCYENCTIKLNDLENSRIVKFPKKYDLVLTLGAAGAEYKGKTYNAHKVNVFDVCGAGDTFLAAFTVAKLSKFSDGKCVEFANLCAGISVKTLGTHEIKLKEIVDEINLRS